MFGVSVENMWRIEKTKESVGFWVGHQGFTVYRRCEETPRDEHELLLDFYDRNLRTALNKLKPKPSQ